MKSKEYLEKIRSARGLQRAVLRKIEVQGNVATFYLATDMNFDASDVEFARETTAGFVSPPLTAEVKIMKSVPSEEGVRAELLAIMKKNYPAAAAFVAPDDVRVSLTESGGAFSVGVADAGGSATQAVADELATELGRRFCGVWNGEFRLQKKDMGEIEREEIAPEERVFALRSFPVSEYAEIDGGKPTRAVYIADLKKEEQNVTVCGTVSYIEERLTKKGKPYFIVTLSDGTGQLRASYFSKKATLEKVRAIQSGDGVCLTGDNELYNGSLNFHGKQIDYGRPPKDFVPEAAPSKPVPLHYKVVFPASVQDFVQSALFDKPEEISPELSKQDLVVFDLETTGLNNAATAGANMDRIIELGAVKIKNGVICERFSSFVACPVKLSPDIIRITGITDDMLKGAPDVSDVLADFYKFCDGCALVGHNVQFDYRFIRYYGDQAEYHFTHKTYDTLPFSQEMLVLNNYRLNTVADHFGVTFHHHRAFDDAFATAKIFLQLVKLKGGLPK